VLTVLAAPLASSAARPAPISPPVIRTGLEKDAGASGPCSRLITSDHSRSRFPRVSQGIRPEFFRPI
jgi:hypothetical protein